MTKRERETRRLYRRLHRAMKGSSLTWATLSNLASLNDRREHGGQIFCPACGRDSLKV